MAENLLQTDALRAAPQLWRSELRNVLATYVRLGLIERADAAVLHQRAAKIIGAEEYEVEMTDVLRLSKLSGCSASDCEYIALADFLDLKLLTADLKFCNVFLLRAVGLV